MRVTTSVADNADGFHSVALTRKRVLMSTSNKTMPLISEWNVIDAADVINLTSNGNALIIPVRDPLTGVCFHRNQYRTPGKDLFWDGKAAYEGEPTPDFSAAGEFATAARATGVIHLAKGVKEELALIQSGYANVLRMTREVASASVIKERLIEICEALDVQRVVYAPDADDAGIQSACNVRDGLAGSGIHADIVRLPYEHGSKQDLFDLYAQDNERFTTNYEDLPALDLPAPQPVETHQPQYTGTADDLWAAWVNEVVKPALDSAAPIVRPYKGDGFRHSPVRPDDNNASFRISYDRDKTTGICIDIHGGVSWHDVASAVGAQSWDDYKADNRLEFIKTAAKANSHTDDDNNDGGTPPPAPQRECTWQPPTDVKADMEVSRDYITQGPLPDGDLAIKSDRGTGKTHFLSRINSDSFIAPSHRRALVDGMAERLGAESSNSFGTDGLANASMRNASKLAITLNKLKHLVDEQGRLTAAGSYDLYLDEVTQYIPHLAGDTFRRGEGSAAYAILKNLIKRARRVIALDAGLDQLTVNWLKSLRPEMRVVVNTKQRQRGRLTVWADSGALLHHTYMKASKSSAPVFVPTDSRRLGNQIARYLSDRRLRVMNVNSETTSDPDVTEFIKDIDGNSRRYDVIIYSPTFGSGVDIQTAAAAVCGFFTGGTLDAPELHQLLDRVRNTDETNVWLPGGRGGNRPIDAYDIYFDGLQAAAATGFNSEFDANGVRRFTTGMKKFHGFLSKVTAQRNESLNNLSLHFIHLCQGFESIEANTQTDKATRDERKAVADLLKEEWRELVLSSAPVTPEQFEELAQAGELDELDRAGFDRWKIQKATGRKIDGDLYENFIDGGDRAALYALTDLLHSELADMKARDRHDARNELHRRRHYAQRYITLQRLIVDVFGEELGEHLHKVTLDADTIAERMETWLYENTATIRTVFGRRTDSSDNPVAILRWMLEKIGLQLSSKQIMRDGERYRVYSLDSERLTYMLDVAASCHARRLADRDETESAGITQNGDSLTTGIPGLSKNPVKQATRFTRKAVSSLLQSFREQNTPRPRFGLGG